MSSTAPFYLGVDAGGTHCRARLINSLGDVIGTGEGGPANTRIGLAKLHETLLAVSTLACNAAGLSAAEVATVSAGMGIAGFNRQGMDVQIRALDFPFANTNFASDAMIANLGAHFGGDGAILILGTGSVGIVKRGEEVLRVGGYGFPISDEGSGAALGLSAMRHALRALDGRTRPTPLSQAVTEQFDQAIPRVIAWMDSAMPRDYASFAPLVMDYADEGDEIAVAIVREAIQHIERFIETLLARGVTRCALMGGLSARMKPWLRARTIARLVEPWGDPLDGALILAGRAMTAPPRASGVSE